MVETHYKIKNAPRIALLADFHNGNPDLIISSLRRHDIDLIAIAGDVIYGSQPKDDKSPLDTQENVAALLRSCASIAPTYMSLGNHEWMLDDEDLQRITDAGVVVLDNGWTKTDIKTPDGKPVIIGGLTSGYVLEYRRFKEALNEANNTAHMTSNPGIADPGTADPGVADKTNLSPSTALSDEAVRYPMRPRRSVGNPTEGLREAILTPSISWLSEFAAAEGTKLLLSHHPSYHSFVPGSVDLILAGHLHGSQWRYYSFIHHEWRGVFNPDERWFPRYSKGLYENGRLVISAGLSNTTWIPRINNPTEIVYINCG